MSAYEDSLYCARSADAAPFVLGALDEPEPFREHLAGCTACQAEVAKLQHVADALPAFVPPERAPEHLRERVLAVVRSDAELARAGGEGVAEAPRRPGRRRRRRLGGATVAWVALATGVAVALAIVLATQPSSPTRVTRAQVTIAGAHASLRQVDGRSELVVTGMPQPAAGRIYQVWVSRGAVPAPTAALFGVTRSGDGAVAVPGSLHGVKEVLVTSEPLGGSAHPTRAPVIRVRV